MHASRSMSVVSVGLPAVCLSTMKCSRSLVAPLYGDASLGLAGDEGSRRPQASGKPSLLPNSNAIWGGVPLLSHKARSVIGPEDAGWNSTCGNTWSSGNSSAVDASHRATLRGVVATYGFALRRSLSGRAWAAS